MADKIRGAIAILVGIAAIVHGGMRYHAGNTSSRTVLEIVAGAVLVAIGTWRIRRAIQDPAEELLK